MSNKISNKKDSFKELALLLDNVKTLTVHQDELRKIKGETFNIFSILGVENRENNTHSNFIAELLSPIGNHLQGTMFLKLFLKIIQHKGELDINTAKVFKEFYIGKKTRSSGGRIDVLIKDDSNNYISIENKIYAGDQENQLIRYCNFKKTKNKVHFLTLFGDEASEFSTKDDELLSDRKDHKLKNGDDYYTLSYSYDILNWLYLCHEKSVNVPQLRESIKQYILLIQKLTNQNMDERDKMIDLLFNNHEAAQKIASEFFGLKDHIRWKFREDVVSELNRKLNNSKFELRIPNPIHRKPIAQIFIHNKALGVKEYDFEILIESFNDNGHHEGRVFIGILDFNSKYADYPGKTVDIGFNKDYWKTARFILYKESHINFRDNSFLNQIKNPKSVTYKQILDTFVNQCLDFINEYSPKMEAYIQSLKKPK